MADKKPILSIKNLSVSAGPENDPIPVLNGVDLDLYKGEVLGLIGESGAGKSTLGLAAMGYFRRGCRVTGGTVTCAGVDLLAMTDQQREAIHGTKIAYVAQSAAASFNPAYRLMDQVTETARIRAGTPAAKARSDALELFERMKLPEPHQFGLRYPHQVSGGQLQRALTAMAMLCQPDIVIFDEPTTALDVTTQVDVLGTMKDAVRDFGIAGIYVSHDLTVVAQMADRIKVLLRGRQVEEAPTRDMLASPQQEYTKSLWSVRKIQKPPSVGSKSPEMRIQVEGVHASYGKVPVLEDVSINVRAGETLAIVGESGSGKSTLARVLTGLLKPRAGRVLLNGTEAASGYRQRSKSDLRAVQMIYQMPDTALNDQQSVGTIIGRPLTFYHGLRGEQNRKRASELLEMIGMDPKVFLQRTPRQLSGGQKQRICIARALAAEPTVLICDEVTSALDQIVAEGILRLLEGLQKDLNFAQVFITHDLTTVRAIADTVAVMELGRIVEFGPRDVVLDDPQKPYTRKLLRSVPEMDPNWLDDIRREFAKDTETATSPEGRAAP